MSQDLFSFQADQFLDLNAPLAERLRPKTLDQFVGQEEILSEGRLLRRAINIDKTGNLLLYGPPGVGKTTLARIIALQTRSRFTVLNAVLSGIKDIRNEIEEAKNKLEMHNLKTTLFIDEVHRFNTSQQDSLLPWVENGTLSFIGATTENPFFAVNKALISRSKIFRLSPLNNKDLHKLLKRALEDSKHGYGRKKISLTEEAANHLVKMSNGDARNLLNSIELAVETTPPNKKGIININLLIAEDSIQRRAVLYDKQGDAHFDTISAFIKSLRGSDPDASLFWLARMLEAGEDPRFIFRRMLICAGEDVGLADPQAIVIVEACAAAFERIGFPEGIYTLSQAALYLANTFKSNSLSGIFSAQNTVRNAQNQDIPLHLRDSHQDGKYFGDGIGYKYPHSFKDNWVSQQYLPDQLQGEIFWKPSNQGWEGNQRMKIFERRTAQLATRIESSITHPFLFNNVEDQNNLDKWIKRQMNSEGERLIELSRRLWLDIPLNMNDRVLVLTRDSLLWSLIPLKAVPEGSVTIASPLQDHLRLSEQLDLVDSIIRPILIDKSTIGLNSLSKNHKFELIGGRLYKEDLISEQFINLWTYITNNLTSSSSLCLIISKSIWGPARSFYQNHYSKSPDKSFLEEIIPLEEKWLESNSDEESFIQKLQYLGWEIQQDIWQEDLSLKIDKYLEDRWFSNNTIYRNFLTQNNIKKSAVDKFRKLFRDSYGMNLPQKISHLRLIGKI